MPFSPERRKEYDRVYRQKMAQGKRELEPETLAEALVELRALRKQVQQQRKRIWFLENKEEHNQRQMKRRRAGFEQNVMATLSTMKKTTSKS